MSEDLAHPTPAGHEPDLLRAGPIAICLLGVVVVLVAIGWAVGAMLPSFHPALPAGNPLPDAPAASDWGEGGRELLRRLREREDANLHAHEWLDASHSAARIPIEQAMERLAHPHGQRGAP